MAAAARFHRVGPRALGPQQRQQADHHGGDGHEFGPHGLRRALERRFDNVAEVADAPLALAPVMGPITVDHRDDAHQGDDPYYGRTGSATVPRG